MESKWNAKLPRTTNDVDVGNARWGKHGGGGNTRDVSMTDQQPHEIYILDDDDDEQGRGHTITERAAPGRRTLPPVSRAAPAPPQNIDLQSTSPASGKGNHNGFQTASTKYVADLRKEGINRRPPPNSGAAGAGGRGNGPALRRGSNGGNAPAPSSYNNNNSASGPGGKFIPPFVKKALQAQQGGNANNNNNANNANNNRGGGNGNGAVVEEDGPLTARTLELLRLSPGDALPEELSKLDPALIEQVCNEVIDSGGEVTWEDIAGQEAAKKLIQEVVVWPMLNPHIFKGARAPPKGILLFGPPGTGKTLLGKAIASNIKASFFSISASSLTSKWIGEGEKMVRVLFAVAGWLAPAVIFIDEIDSLLSARKSEGEHEASRRLKTEMLIQMEGCDPASASRRVLLIGATNRPEELDEAARRRMPKQLYIPLPCGIARKQMIVRQLGPGAGVAATLSESDLDKIVLKTDGYSGSDMKNLIQEACQGPVRDAVRAAGAGVAALSESDLRAVVVKDFAVAARAQRASVEPKEVVRYEEYNEKHGAKIVGEGGEGGEGTGEDDMDDDW
jgi:AAA+ superfamily predicted ATPase